VLLSGGAHLNDVHFHFCHFFSELSIMLLVTVYVHQNKSVHTKVLLLLVLEYAYSFFQKSIKQETEQCTG